VTGGGATLAVAVSGGADSLAALLRLRDAGHTLIALHGQFLPEHDQRAAQGLAEACARLGVPLHLLDMRTEFEALVAGPFAAEYLAGRTPNPCARCNAAMKFGLLLDRALALGAGALATGHFAGAGTHPAYGWALSRGADPVKDQSYFLSLVPRGRLLRARFPLAEVSKAAARGELDARGEVAFAAGEPGYLLRAGRRLPRLFWPRAQRRCPPWRAQLPDGTPRGAHQGLWRATIGQRRGLGLSWREPLYVLDKVLRGIFWWWPRARFCDGLVRGWRGECACGSGLVAGGRAVQTRYREAAKSARLEFSGGILRVRFDEPQVRPAPGQVAAVYDAGGAVLAGSVIC